jgi:hypothetical protein
MSKFVSLAAAALLFAAPSFAQKMGMANNDAPTISQTIETKGAKITLNYTSITWATGQTMDAAMNKEKGASTRKRINDTAKNAPLGEFTTSTDVTCGDLKIPAGSYKLAFTINDNTDWEINFINGDKTLTMKLPLMASPEEAKRLLLCLYAGNEGGAGVYVSFGKKMCMLNFTAGGETKKAEKTEKK